MIWMNKILRSLLTIIYIPLYVHQCKHLTLKISLSLYCDILELSIQIPELPNTNYLEVNRFVIWKTAWKNSMKATHDLFSFFVLLRRVHKVCSSTIYNQQLWYHCICTQTREEITLWESGYCPTLREWQKIKLCLLFLYYSCILVILCMVRIWIIRLFLN